MAPWPMWQYSFSYTPAMYGSHTLDLLADDIRCLGSGQYTGETWWFAFLDTDGNGYVNGGFTYNSNTSIAQTELKTGVDPGAIAYGQTATSGPALVAQSTTSILFNLTPETKTNGMIRQGWGDVLGNGIKHILIEPYHIDQYPYGTSVYPNALLFNLTNRNFICDQDLLNFGTNYFSNTAIFVQSYTNNPFNETSSRNGWR